MNAPHRVLVVDDERAIRLALELAFEGSAFQAESVEDAESALARLDHESFDIVMVDKNLPGMSGIDFIRAVNERKDPPVCVLMTGFSTPGARVAAYSSGARHYIEKPFRDVYALIGLLERFAAGRSLDQTSTLQSTGSS